VHSRSDLTGPLGFQYKSLSDLVYRRLRDQIIWGIIRPGSILSVRKLAEELAVSPMPVREALLRLALEELVDVSPRSSTRVTRISLDCVREICEMRNYLEPLAARLAVPHLTPTDLKHIRQWLKKMDAAAVKDRPEDWHRWNQELHGLMFRKCGNSFLERVARDMWERNLRHFTAGALAKPGFRARRGAEHRRILKAIEKGDPEATEAAWRDHTTQSGVETLEYLHVLHANGVETHRAQERRRDRKPGGS
jgi:DNA-binding GntR family transcriptional regulator